MHERGVHAGVRREQRGKIGHHADIRDHRVQIVGLHDLAHDVFHLLYVIFGHFDARAGGSFHVDDELAGIGAGKKRNSDERKQEQSSARKSDETTSDLRGRSRAFCTHRLVEIQHLFEFGVECRVEPGAPGLFGRFRDPLPCS